MEDVRECKRREGPRLALAATLAARDGKAQKRIEVGPQRQSCRLSCEPRRQIAAYFNIPHVRSLFPPLTPTRRVDDRQKCDKIAFTHGICEQLNLILKEDAFDDVEQIKSQRAETRLLITA